MIKKGYSVELTGYQSNKRWELKEYNAIVGNTYKVARVDSQSSIGICNLIAYYVVVEGLFFYTGFPTVLALGRRNKMNGVAEQFQYILRDESMHLNFGIDVINQIKIENPNVWTKETQDKAFDLIIEGLSLEIDFAKLMLPNGVLGMNFEMITDYQKFITNRRLQQVGLPIVNEWVHIDNPLPWMSEMMDLRKEKNFFETKVTDYQAGGLDWDD